MPLGEGARPRAIVSDESGNAWVLDSGLNAILRIGGERLGSERFPLPAKAAPAGLESAVFDDDGRLTASSIYDWFQDDFGGDEEGVIAHLRAYASPALAAKLDAIDDIDEFDYDWTLNDAAPVENSRKGRAGSAQR